MIRVVSAGRFVVARGGTKHCLLAYAADTRFFPSFFSFCAGRLSYGVDFHNHDDVEVDSEASLVMDCW